MRVLSGGVAHVACVIEDDLEGRETGLEKPQRSALADLAASVLTCRNVNTAEWAVVLPRKIAEKSKERYISRFLSNSLIKPISVMKGFIPELVEIMGTNGKVVILMLDQSKICDGFECLMISLPVSNAIPRLSPGLSHPT